MKTIISLIMLCAIWLNVMAQAPQKMSYQAVIRDAGGNLVINHAVGMKASIIQGSPTGMMVFQELYQPNPQTNANGLVSIEIGTGIPLTGTFSEIDWSTGPYFLKTETDPTGGTNYSIIGTSQLLSVPYALYAQTSTDAVTLTGNQTIAGKKTFTDTISASNKTVINVGNPVNAQDAATKAYVDELKLKVFAMEDMLMVAGLFTVSDVEGNSYKVVKIGDQVWMAENLKTTKYNDGTPIPLVSDNTAWSKLATPGYCWYNNDKATYGNIYGALYNWYAINAGKLCPDGWHVPSDAEWTTLTTFLGGEAVAGGKMKETGTTHWQSPNTGATNESGFSGLPGGYRHDNGTFSGVVGYGNWWSFKEGSTTNPWHRGLYYLDASVYRFNYSRILGFSIRCVRDAVSIPSVTTATPDSIANNLVLLGGEVIYEGGSTVTERGVCYGTTRTPTIENTKVAMGSGTGTFKSKVTGLTANTTYYARAYAINSQGTAYGQLVSFTTDCENCATVTDIEGNVYRTVQIGTQFWMHENLKTTKYNDGTGIPLVTDATAWANLITPGYCWYNNDKATYGNIYGALYNWYTLNMTKLCPTGWHVPSNAEWTTLTTFLGGETSAGGKMKETGTTHWQSPNTGATNESGFSALPGGSRGYDGYFSDIVTIGLWWSSTEDSTTDAWLRYVFYYDTSVGRISYTKRIGISVRCLRD